MPAEILLDQEIRNANVASELIYPGAQLRTAK